MTDATDRARRMLAQLLAAMKADLDQVVRPAIADPNASANATMISDILARLVVWHGDRPAAAANAARNTDALAQDFGFEGQSPSDYPSDDALPPAEAYGANNLRLQAAVEEGSLISGEADRILAIDAVLEEQEAVMLSVEAERAIDQRPTAEVDVTSDRLATFALAAGIDGRFGEAKRIYGGFSKDTFLIDLEREGEVATGYVLRRDLPFGPAGTRVVDEFRLLRALVGRGLPIAEPIWCTEDEAHFGTPAMISRRVHGRSGIGDWGDDPERCAAIVKELAGVVARLHAIEPAEVGMEAPIAPRDAVRDHVLSWQVRWQDNRVHPSPALAVGFDWLLDNIPQQVERLVPVHGDIGFHNVMVADDRITALLDWEFAHAGDAAEDLGYARQFIEPIADWNMFLGHYRDAGGGVYYAENARFYEVWRAVRNAVCCATAWRGFVDGRYPALKMAYQGVVFYRHFKADAVTQLRKVRNVIQ